MRHILLVDMNAFYILCESLKNPELKNKPAAVAGDPQYRTGIILTSNYLAREKGVKTAMTVNQAKRCCPDLILVKPNMKFYKQCSEEVFSIFYRYSPIVEHSSIDEGYLDITNSLAIFGSPYDIAKSIMNEIKEELGLFCSIGISENKFLAKMACEQKKPLGITQIYKKDIKEKMWPLPISQMYGIGKKNVQQLNRLGFETIGDIANGSKKLLLDHFNKYGMYLYMRANGQDDHKVVTLCDHKNESIGKSTTLPVDVIHVDIGKKALAKLTEEVCEMLRMQGKKTKTIQITIKYNTFQTITRQKTIEYTDSTKKIMQTAFDLFEESWDLYRPVRLVGISVHNLNQCRTQLSFFEKQNDEKNEQLDKTMDHIKSKYGNKSIHRGNTL